MLNDLRGKAATNDEGFLDHGYLPSFVHRNKARGYARSFGAQFNYQNHRFAGWAKAMPGFGKAYKASVKAAYPAILDFTPYGEMLPNVGSCRPHGSARSLPLARRWRPVRNEESCSTTWCGGASDPGACPRS